MSYQSPDASKELKKGNIASFFKTGTSAKATNSSFQNHVANIKSVKLAPPEVKTEQENAQQAQTASARSQDSSFILPVEKGGAPPSVTREISPVPSTNQQQTTTVKEGEDAENGKAGGRPGLKQESDVLNTDDAGGIGESKVLLPLPHDALIVVSI